MPMNYRAALASLLVLYGGLIKNASLSSELLSRFVIASIDRDEIIQQLVESANLLLDGRDSLNLEVKKIVSLVWRIANTNVSVEQVPKTRLPLNLTKFAHDRRLEVVPHL